MCRPSFLRFEWLPEVRTYSVLINNATYNVDNLLHLKSDLQNTEQCFTQCLSFKGTQSAGTHAHYIPFNC